MAREPAQDLHGVTQLVAPGIWRVGDWLVNVYLVEDGGRLTLVDAGLSRMYDQLLAALQATGHSLEHIDAVVLTHGHPDHVGMAERVRQESGARVWVHQDDGAMVADPRHATRYSSNERSFLPYLLRRPATVRVPVHIGLQGGSGRRRWRSTRPSATGRSWTSPGTRPPSSWQATPPAAPPSSSPTATP